MNFMLYKEMQHKSSSESLFLFGTFAMATVGHNASYFKHTISEFYYS